MSAEWFLWGGFWFSVVWHAFSWWLFKVTFDQANEAAPMSLAIMNLGLSGVALCGFGLIVSS